MRIFESNRLQLEQKRKLKRWKKPCVALVEDRQLRIGSGAKRAAQLVCEIDSGETYTVNVPEHWLQEEIKKGKIRSGLHIKMPKDAYYDEERAEIKMSTLPAMASAPVGEEPSTRRELAVLEGAFSVLVVRVVAKNGVATTKSEEALANSVFGKFGQAVNMKSQYDNCSHSKLQFEMAANKNGISSNTKIRNGVTTIYVDTSIRDGDSVMRNAITERLNSEFKVSKPDKLADFVMYCLPPGTFDSVAYAYIDSWNSIYNDEWCSSLSAQMHEVGHNLNLGHRYEVIEIILCCSFNRVFFANRL